jgi:hypothetical protein
MRRCPPGCQAPYSPTPPPPRRGRGAPAPLRLGSVLRGPAPSPPLVLGPRRPSRGPAIPLPRFGTRCVCPPHARPPAPSRPHLSLPNTHSHTTANTRRRSALRWCDGCASHRPRRPGPCPHLAPSGALWRGPPHRMPPPRARARQRATAPPKGQRRPPKKGGPTSTHARRLAVGGWSGRRAAGPPAASPLLPLVGAESLLNHEAPCRGLPAVAPVCGPALVRRFPGLPPLPGGGHAGVDGAPCPRYLQQRRPAAAAGSAAARRPCWRSPPLARALAAAGPQQLLPWIGQVRGAGPVGPVYLVCLCSSGCPYHVVPCTMQSCRVMSSIMCNQNRSNGAGTQRGRRLVQLSVRLVRSASGGCAERQRVAASSMPASANLRPAASPIF